MEYRLYFLNQGDHISEFLAFEERGDEAAIIFANERSRGRPIELWQRERLVMRRGPGDGSPESAVAAKPHRKAG